MTTRQYFNSLVTVDMFSALAKRVVKSIANTDKMFSVKDTANDLFLNWNTDSLTEEIISTVYVACYDTEIDNLTVATSLKTRQLFIVCLNDSYLHIVQAVCRFLSDNKAVRASLPIDDFIDVENGEDVTVSSHDKKAYIQAITKDLYLSDENRFHDVNETVNRLIDYIKDNETAKKADELINVIDLMCIGIPVKSKNAGNVTIAKLLNMDISKAEYRVRKIKKHFADMVKDDISRRVIVHVPVMGKYGIVWKVAKEHDATLTDMTGKTYKSKVYTDKYTDEILEKMEGKAVRKLVVNMDKNAYKDGINGTVNANDFSRCGSNGFSYGMLSGYTKPEKQKKITVPCNLTDNLTGKTITEQTIIPYVIGKRKNRQPEKQRKIEISNVPINSEYKKPNSSYIGMKDLDYIRPKYLTAKTGLIGATILTEAGKRAMKHDIDTGRLVVIDSINF